MKSKSIPKNLENGIRASHPNLGSIRLYSRKFIFSREYEEIRCDHILGNKPTRTLLSFLLHEWMDSEHRQELFPGKFDLGNCREIPDHECIYKNLCSELSIDGEGKDELETVKNGIKRLTGRSTADFSEINKLITLKVIKTLYTITRERSNRIFSALEAPEVGKAGLEFRIDYPNDKSRKLMHLVADIREYLGAELPTEKIINIQNAFSELQGAVDNADIHIQKIFLSSSAPKYASLISAYDKLLQSIENYQFPSPSDTLLRLDETFYIYLSSLEIRHFSRQFPKLLEVARSGIKVNSIANQIKQTTETNKLVKVKHLPDFMRVNMEKFQQLLAQAIGMEIDLHELLRYIPLSVELIKRVRIFDPNQSRDPAEIEVSIADILAAIIAIQADHKSRTNHKPYWHGQPAVGDSLLESLKMEFSDKYVYEEHSQIWRVRLNHYKAALNGHSEWYEKRMKVSAGILARFAELACYRDVTEILRNASDFLTHIGVECQALKRGL
ncbi:hypothetical protein MCEMSEM22_02182 [Comamonadaceae bacterium]